MEALGLNALVDARERFSGTLFGMGEAKIQGQIHDLRVRPVGGRGRGRGRGGGGWGGDMQRRRGGGDGRGAEEAKGEEVTDGVSEGGSGAPPVISLRVKVIDATTVHFIIGMDVLLRYSCDLMLGSLVLRFNITSSDDGGRDGQDQEGGAAAERGAWEVPLVLRINRPGLCTALGAG